MYVPGRDGKEGENRPRRIVIRSSGCSPHMRSVPLITKTRTIVEDIGHPPIVSSAKTPASAAASFCKVFSFRGFHISICLFCHLTFELVTLFRKLAIKMGRAESGRMVRSIVFSFPSLFVISI